MADNLEKRSKIQSLEKELNDKYGKLNLSYEEQFITIMYSSKELTKNIEDIQNDIINFVKDEFKEIFVKDEFQGLNFGIGDSANQMDRCKIDSIIYRLKKVKN